jgi:hypothetical protein
MQTRGLPEVTRGQRKCMISDRKCCEDANQGSARSDSGQRKCMISDRKGSEDADQGSPRSDLGSA